MALEIVRLRTQHLAGAAALFAERFRFARRQEGLLPAQYEKPESVLPLLTDLAANNPVVVALRAGRVVGVLGGFVLPNFRGRKAVYSQEWANGLAPGEVGETFWRLYEGLCGDWVADGCDFHVLTVMAADAVTVSALRWMGFFGISVDAVRGFEPVAGQSDGMDIRRAEPKDIDDLIRLEDMQIQHMHDAPVLFPFARPDSRRQHEKALADNGRPIWLARISGRPIGYIRANPIKPDAGFLLQDSKTASITGAYVEKERRGKGAAPALLQGAVSWARDEGYARLAVDFEPENAVASRFWCRHFRVTGLSFGRVINKSS